MKVDCVETTIKKINTFFATNIVKKIQIHDGNDWANEISQGNNITISFNGCPCSAPEIDTRKYE